MNVIESIWNNCNDTQFKYTCFQDPSRGKQCSSNGILDCVKISFALQHRQDTEAEKKKVLVTLLLPHNDIALPKSDQYQFFPNNIHLQTGEEVKRIHKVITKGEML